MDVEAAMARGVEDGLREDQAVSGDHGQIRLECREGGLFFGLSERAGAAHFNTQCTCANFDRSWTIGLAAARGAGRLRVGGNDVMPGRHQRVERRHRKLRATHENDPHG
jgi:hypothetical protein